MSTGKVITHEPLKDPMEFPWLVYSIKFRPLSAEPEHLEILGQYKINKQAFDAAEYENKDGGTAHVLYVNAEQYTDPVSFWQSLNRYDPSDPYYQGGGCVPPPKHESWLTYAIRTAFGFPAPPPEHDYTRWVEEREREHEWQARQVEYEWWVAAQFYDDGDVYDDPHHGDGAAIQREDSEHERQAQATEVNDALMSEEQVQKESAERPGEFCWGGEDFVWIDSPRLVAEDAAHERAAQAIEEAVNERYDTYD